jgi:hypothetical protein
MDVTKKAKEKKKVDSAKLTRRRGGAETRERTKIETARRGELSTGFCDSSTDGEFMEKGVGRVGGNVWRS